MNCKEYDWNRYFKLDNYQPRRKKALNLRYFDQDVCLFKEE